jgi:O-antigen ligase
VYLGKKIEPGITLLLILFYADVSFSSIVSKALAAGAYIIIPILIIGQRKRFIYVATRDILLIFTTLTAVLSFIWSTAPEATLINIRALLLITLFGVYLATRYSPKDLMHLMLWMSGIAVFFSIVFSLSVADYGTHIVNGELSWRGIFKHKNYLALRMAFAAITFLIFSLDNRRLRWLALTGTGISFVVLLLTNSKSSLSLFVLSLLLIPLYNLFKFSNYKLQAFLLVTVVLVFGSAATGVFSNLQFLVVDLMGKDLGGNGRDELWSYLITRGLERPWLGYGYAGFWNNLTEVYGVAANTWFQALELGSGHAHSGFVDLFLQLGWLGSSLVMLSFLTVIIRLVNLLSLTKKIEYFWMLQFVILMFGSNFSVAASFLGNRHIFWILYIATALSSAIQYSRISKVRDLNQILKEKKLLQVLQ